VLHADPYRADLELRLIGLSPNQRFSRTDQRPSGVRTPYQLSRTC
jgi:hypothetical protein